MTFAPFVMVVGFLAPGCNDPECVPWIEEGGRYTVTVGEEIFTRPVERTSSNAEFKTVTVGRVQFKKPGRYRLWVRPDEIPGNELMRLQKVTLKRTGS
jgi:hypothetical protein